MTCNGNFRDFSIRMSKILQLYADLAIKGLKMKNAILFPYPTPHWDHLQIPPLSHFLFSLCLYNTVYGRQKDQRKVNTMLCHLKDEGKAG